MRFRMPFQDREKSREELCRLALAEGSNRRELCRRFNVQPRILYKWLERYRALGADGLADRSRRPHRSPGRTDRLVEAAVLAVRRDNPACGCRAKSNRHTEHSLTLVWESQPARSSRSPWSGAWSNKDCWGMPKTGMACLRSEIDCLL